MNILKLLFALVLVVGSKVVIAQGLPDNPVFKKCAEDNHISLPDSKSGQKIDNEKRKIIYNCVGKTHKDAFTECSKKAGFTPAPNVRPTEAQKQSIHKCLDEKGFKNSRPKQKN